MDLKIYQSITKIYILNFQQSDFLTMALFESTSFPRSVSQNIQDLLDICFEDTFTHDDDCKAIIKQLKL